MSLKPEMKNASPSTMGLRYGDLFAGAGGLSLGFHDAGFTPVFFNEIDEQTSETFLHNFPNATPFVCPIQELTTKKIRERCDLNGDSPDVMIAGPPCQGFSINAPVRSDDDPRNHLFRHYVRLVLEGLRPKFVVLENVPGLVSLDNGRTVQEVVAAFEQAGYRVAFHILNAAHYGVPQERWRLFFIGTRLPDVQLSFPAPTHYSLQRPNFTGGRGHTFRHAIGESGNALLQDPLCAPVTIRDAISDLPPIGSGNGNPTVDYSSEPSSDYQRRMRRDSAAVYNHECANLSSINLERIKFVGPGGSWRDIPHELLPKGMQRARRSDHTKRYGRLDPNKLSGTIMTKCDPHWGTVIHYNQDRIISVREAARIQSFPDWFRFTGSKVDMYKQVGNAVPPLLAYALAAHIKKMICESAHK